MRSNALLRQRHAWRRRPWMDCGHTEPCRCDYHNHPTPKRVDGYRDALEHLAAEGYPAAPFMPECRELWRRGGSDRKLAEATVRRWSA